ncbi:hypothetical protein BJ546DRAFT_841067 [Cryomyces antarcticus]
MSEVVDSRPAALRSRGSARGGRAGFGRGGPRRGSRQANGGTRDAASFDAPEDKGELGDMKKQYSSQLSMLKELFPDWTDVDLVFALQETDGDLQGTIERITEGKVSQFSDVKKAGKDRSRSKAKDASSAITDQPMIPARGGRGRGGFEGTRGGRGRGADRGRGGFRGGRGGLTSTNGFEKDTTASSVPTTDSSARDTTGTAEASAGGNAGEQAGTATTTDKSAERLGGLGSVVASEITPAAASEGAKSSMIPEGGAQKSWASLLAKPKLAPVPQKPAALAPPLAEIGLPPAEPITSDAVREETVEPEALPPSPITEEPLAQELPTADTETTLLQNPEASLEDVDLQITPSKDELTEDNVEHLPDVSMPIATETVASTVASSQDPRNLAGSATPLTASQQPPISRPPMGGFATSAYKATGMPGRSASFQRRVLEQQEAVVMPGNHAVDRAAVQFGSMGLNGDSDGLDVDEEREEPETRTQPPPYSPPSQPRASLPPAPHQSSLSTEALVQDAVPTPKQAPGLPPAPQHQHSMAAQGDSSHNPLGSQPVSQQGSQGGQQYDLYGRYGPSGMQPEASAPAQKPYDPFSHQTAQSGQYDSYGTHSQTPGQQQHPGPSHLGGFSSAPTDYSSYYTSDQQRNAYQNYYGGAGGSYGQQITPMAQDPNNPSQRQIGGFSAPPNEPAYPGQAPTPQQVGAFGFGSRRSSYDRAMKNLQLPVHNNSNSSPQSQPRYGDAQNSGHATPNSTAAGQQQPTAPSQQQHNMQQPHSQSGHAAGAGAAYPYGHPYYQSPYNYAYMNQFGYNQQQQGYGGGFSNKGGMYGQSHQGYGMPPQSSYEQSSSPANVGGFGQSSMHGREGGLGSGLGDYGRTSSAQASQSIPSSGAFGSLPESYGRAQSGFPGQAQAYSQQQGVQQAGNDESLKPFGESKTGGPSPSLGQPGRPASATNNAGGQAAQSGLPPPQSHQQGFGGGYPGFGQGSQYGGLGYGGHESASSNNGYGAGFGGNSYGSYGGRGGGGGGGGWGQAYGGH